MQAWTAPQRAALIVIVIALLALLALRYALNPTYVGDPQPAQPSRFSELADLIDPNDADIPTLSALPLIGDKRAAEIVAYRNRVRRNDPDRIAFTRVEDLLRIRGIGPATIEQLRPFLIFRASAAQPATQPRNQRMNR